MLSRLMNELQNEKMKKGSWKWRLKLFRNTIVFGWYSFGIERSARALARYDQQRIEKYLGQLVASFAIHRVITTTSSSNVDFHDRANNDDFLKHAVSRC